VSLPAAGYRPRNPQSSDYYRCVEDYLETFVSIYDDHFSRPYGFWRPYLENVIVPIAGGHLQAQGAQDAPEQGEAHEGDDRHALNMAAFRLQRFLRRPHISKR
jgi:hypothetical protein